MAALESFRTTNATLTRNDAEKLIEISGNSVRVDDILDGPMGVWTPSSYNSSDQSYTIFLRHHEAIETGDPILVANTGGSTNYAQGDIVYAIKGTAGATSGHLSLATSAANAAAGTKINLGGGAYANARLIPLVGRHPAGILTPGSVTTASNLMTVANARDAEVINTGDPVRVVANGGFTGFDIGTTYYARKANNNQLTFYTDWDSADSGGANNRVSISGTGTAANVRLQFYSGGVPAGYRVRCSSGGVLRFANDGIGAIGSYEGSIPTFWVEEDDAGKFGQNNYSNDGASRFQKDCIAELINVRIKVNTEYESANRSDFDISRGTTTQADGARVRFRNCSVETDTQYNHLGGSRIVIDGLRWRNTRFDNLIGNQFEMTHGLTTAPKGLEIDAADGAFVRFITSSFTDDVPVRVNEFKGANVDLHRGNANRILELVDPDPSVGVAAGTPSDGDGVVRILRTQPLDLNGHGVGTIYFDSEDTGGDDVSVTIGTSDDSVSPILRIATSAHGVTTFAHARGYSVQALGFDFRKVKLAEQDVADTPTDWTLDLVSDEFPDGSHPTTFASSPTTPEELYRAIKTHEIANRSALSADTPLATIDDDGYIAIPDDWALNLVTTGSSVVATSSPNSVNTITVMVVAGSLGASTTGIVGIRVGGTGTITLNGVTLTNMLVADSAGANGRLDVTGPDGATVAAYTSDGTEIIAETDLAAGSLTASGTFATGDADTKIVCARAGYDPVVQSVDTTAGGIIAVTFGDLVENIQADGTASLGDTESLVTADFVLTDLTAVGMRVDIANGQVRARGLWSSVSTACATGDGLKYLAFGGEIPTLIRGVTGDTLYFAETVKLRRTAASDVNAAIVATVSHPSGLPVDGANGSVIVLAGLDVASLGRTLSFDVDLDSETAGVQSIAYHLLKVKDIEDRVADPETGITLSVAVRAMMAALFGNATVDSANGNTRFTFARVGGGSNIVRVEIVGDDGERTNSEVL